VLKNIGIREIRSKYSRLDVSEDTRNCGGSNKTWRDICMMRRLIIT
jgi:hypothetical protein